MLINDDLIWICIPKNASFSIHLALNNANKNIFAQGNNDKKEEINQNSLEENGE